MNKSQRVMIQPCASRLVLRTEDPHVKLRRLFDGLRPWLSPIQLRELLIGVATKGVARLAMPTQEVLAVVPELRRYQLAIAI